MSPPAPRGEDWDALAGWWKATFTGGADEEYERQILPIIRAGLAHCQRVLDLGCGEGQVARDLAAHLGALVVGIDPSSNQLKNAVAEGGPVTYVQAAGEAIPFASASFDGVCCCLVIEHSEDADALLGEVARLLEVGGRFALLINHPLYQGPGSGLIDDHLLDERYWRVGPYLSEGRTVEEVDPGVEVRFSHRPLSRYVNPLADLDVVLVELHEPPPPADLISTSPAPELEASIPRLCALVFEKRPPPPIA